MRINPNINKQVKQSMADCRESLIKATIILLHHYLGAESGEDVSLGKTLVLHQENSNHTTETVVCSFIAYCASNGNPFLMVSMGKDCPVPYRSSHFLSISNLAIIYDTVRSVVRQH